MQAAWVNYVSKAVEVFRSGSPASLDEAVDAALRCAYFWFNFMPITRGAAAVGWTVLQAMLLVCGCSFASSPPPGYCMDWDAILTPTVGEFTSHMRDWLVPATASKSGQQPDDWLRQLPDAAAVFATIGEVLQALGRSHPSDF